MAVADEVAAFARERRYAEPTQQRWSRLSDTDAAALLHLARPLQLSENQLRDVWQWLDDVALRDHISLAQVLESPTLQSVLGSSLARAEKIKALKSKLREMRFPQLVAVEQKARQLISALDLPRQVVVELPPHLEGDSIRLSITVSSVVTLQQAAAALLSATNRPQCAELFHLLEEAP